MLCGCVTLFLEKDYYAELSFWDPYFLYLSVLFFCEGRGPFKKLHPTGSKWKILSTNRFERELSFCFLYLYAMSLTENVSTYNVVK